MQHSLDYWKQSTGLTGQCLTERTQALYDSTSGLYKQVTGEHLSKTALYRHARHYARQTKKETGGRIMDTASAIMGIQLIELRKHLRKIKNRKRLKLDVQFETIEICNLKELASGKRGRRKVVNEVA
tara:strand:- start:1032 stop:1412 length:381 start_codon:yes stop_codon:yes gene_type:complete